MKILVAPDKFKGSLKAAAAAAAIARGLLQAWPAAEVVALPIADGGEGFLDALACGERVQAAVHDALGRPIVAEYGWADESTAVIEMSAASGLGRIAPPDRCPLRSSTFGTGELIADALARGAAKILVGLGGSATNDGGAGMAAALGYRFLDAAGEPVPVLPANYRRIALLQAPPAGALSLPKIIAACDVDNPLLGPRGATRVYGPQKGAAPDDQEELETALTHLADLVSRDLGCDFREVSGAGAAGGLGFGLLGFCKAEIRAGFDVVAEALGLEEQIKGADLIVTGEGRIDAQTLHGKGPAGVAALARHHGKTVIAFAGECEECQARGIGKVFDAVYPIMAPGITREEAMGNAGRLLEQIARGAAEAMEISSA